MNNYYRGKHDILLLNLLSSMDQKDMNKLTSQLDDVNQSENIRLDLDNILNTFDGDYDRLAKSIREQVYYKAATDVNREQLEDSDLLKSEFVTELIRELDLPRGRSYEMGLHNSIEFMLDKLAYQGLSVTLSEWLIFAAMWDQPPYNYVDFIIDIWSDEDLNAVMREYDYHKDTIIALESLVQADIFDRYRGLRTISVHDYEDELVELLEAINYDMGEGYTGEITVQHRLKYIRHLYSNIRKRTTQELALKIMNALYNRRSIELFKLVYEYYINRYNSYYSNRWNI